MKLLKKLSMFDGSIVVLIAFFIVSQFISLLNVESIYVQDVHLPKALYLLISIVSVLSIIALFYYLPTTIVLETITLVITLNPLLKRKTAYRSKPKNKRVFVIPDLHLRYGVFRC